MLLTITSLLNKNKSITRSNGSITTIKINTVVINFQLSITGKHYKVSIKEIHVKLNVVKLEKIVITQFITVTIYKNVTFLR